MDLQGYLRTLRKGWWIILIVTVLGGGAGFLLNALTTPTYQSKVTFYVSTPSESAGSSAYQANQYALARIGSYSQLLTSDELAKRIVADAQLTLSPGAVASKITASSELNTVTLTATVTDSSQQGALTIATAIANDFGPLVDELDNRTGTNGAEGSAVALKVISGPTTSAEPISPKTDMNIALGAIAGLVIGVALALLRGVMDTTVRSLDALRTVAGTPVLGGISYDGQAKKHPILVGDKARSVRAEAFRTIRTNLQFMDVDNPVQVLIVTSSIASEGKSTTATNLAIVYAETGRRVLLVEADMRRPRVSDYLGLERAVGLSNVLAGQVAYTDVLQSWGTDGLMVMPSGSVPPNPSELLGSQNMVDLIEDLRGYFDIIIIDTPPLLPVTDAAVASTWADGVLVVVRYGKTSKTQIGAAIHSLRTVDARLLGCVLSMLPSKGADAPDGYDGYGYYEDDASKGPSADLPRPAGLVHRNQARHKADNGATPVVEVVPAAVAEAPARTYRTERAGVSQQPHPAGRRR